MELDDHLTLEFGKSGELSKQSVKDYQSNGKQSLVESRDSGFGFEQSYSPNQTGKKLKANQFTSDESLSNQLYKAKTIKKRSQRVRRQFKLNSLDCSFENSLDLNTISSADSRLTETENSFELNDTDDLKAPLVDLNESNLNECDSSDKVGSNLNENKSELNGDSQRNGLKSSEKSTTTTTKKSTSYLISKDEFKKRISADDLNGENSFQFKDNSRKRTRNRLSKKHSTDKQTSTNRSPLNSNRNQSFKNRNYQSSKSLSSSSLNDEQSSKNSHTTTTKTIGTLRNQMLDIVNSVSKSNQNRIDYRLDIGDRVPPATRHVNHKQQINHKKTNQPIDRNTSTVTTKTVSTIGKACLHTTVAPENSSYNVWNRKQQNRHHPHHNGWVYFVLFVCLLFFVFVIFLIFFII